MRKKQPFTADEHLALGLAVKRFRVAVFEAAKFRFPRFLRNKLDRLHNTLERVRSDLDDEACRCNSLSYPTVVYYGPTEPPTIIDAAAVPTELQAFCDLLKKTGVRVGQRAHLRRLHSLLIDVVAELRDNHMIQEIMRDHLGQRASPSSEGWG